MVLTAVVLFWLTLSSRAPKVVASVSFGDGRILQVEAVTYGKTHHVGSARSEVLRRLSSILPASWLARLEPKTPLSTIDGYDHPVLVVWVNAVDEKSLTNVDCQSIRVELVDDLGQHFESATSSWSGGQKFWRVGHVFTVYPRTAENLTMEITTWRKNKTNRVEFPNPHVVRPDSWTGAPLPQQQSVGDLNIVLTGLRLRTNGLPPKYYTTRAVFWDPVWELRHSNEKVSGWSKPEWFAEDPTGNRGQQLGTNQPVLRFSATFYPAATNSPVAQLLATMPPTIVTNVPTTNWWNQTAQFDGQNISILGWFPRSNYVFSEGVLLTNPPFYMGPVGGGAPSGWTWQTTSVSPIKDVHYSGHYSTTNDIIYVSAPNLDEKIHLAMRLRDDQGHYYLAKLDPAGPDTGIYPFLISLPPEVKQVTPELVALKPVEAKFTVAVPVKSNP